jgi:hypothetical protein
VGSSEKVMDATNVLQKLHHARSKDKVMWRWTGVTVAVFEILMAACTLFLRTTTNLGKPAGPEAAGTPGSC